MRPYCTTFLTPADLLARGLNLPLPAVQPVATPPSTCCAITGQPITSGYLVADMVTEATAEFLDCFRGGIGGWVSESAARCFKSADPRRGNPCARSVLAFEDGTLYNPLINRESAAAQERPCWSDLVRQVWPARRGEQMLAILTTDTKKRLWIRARVGALGPRTPLLYYDSGTGNEVLIVDWPMLLAGLELCELIYGLGFPKEAIRGSLYVASKVCETVGLSVARELEGDLARWRERPEFRPALLMAQRTQAVTPKTKEEETWKPEQITLPL